MSVTDVAPPPPRLADGVELLGRLEGSAFKQPPFMVRRQDGQMIQLPGLLYAVAERADGRHDAGSIADELTHRIGRGVSAEDVGFLVEEKLRPLGILAGANGATPRVEKTNPLLGLTWQKALVPDRGVRRITSPFLPLFHPVVATVAVAAFLALDGWLLFSHGIGQPVRTALYQPAFLLALFGGMVLATGFHEVGHATAGRYGGARPGVIGVGIYVVWPVFYTDVTDAYRLPRSGRLRTDLGGVYFNAIFALAVGAAYFATGSEPLLLLVLLQNFAILQQLLPLGRLDGYLIVSDLTGVPDILTRLRPILRSLIPWRAADERVKQLKPWARWVVSGYVLVLIPVMLLALLLMLIHAPRAFATAYDSVAVRWDQVSAAFGSADLVRGLAGSLQVAALIVPCAGMAATTARIGRRAGTAALAWGAGQPVRQSVLVAGATSLFTLAAFTWWPNGDYRPIQPGERGTIQAGVRNVSHLASGRPALTAEREFELGGAPSVRDRERHDYRPSPSEDERGAPGAEPLEDGASRDEEAVPGDELFSPGDEPTPDEGSTPYAVPEEQPTPGTQPAPGGEPTAGTQPAPEREPAPQQSPPPEEEPSTTTPEPAPEEETTTEEPPPTDTTTTTPSEPPP